MTQEKRIKIAEACGWTGVMETYADGLMGFAPFNPEYDDNQWLSVPDYFNDLDAMHEAEKVLYRGIEHQRYWQAGYGRYKTILGEFVVEPLSATAAQRAEAFGRVKGLWI